MIDIRNALLKTETLRTFLVTNSESTVALDNRRFQVRSPEESIQFRSAGGEIAYLGKKNKTNTREKE